ncbi:MAG: hypothetical protein L3K16_09835 [Thermoplasmata archaeon]|nr:hypothetical protein [Thermoplasmata archaeon]
MATGAAAMPSEALPFDRLRVQFKELLAFLEAHPRETDDVRLALDELPLSPEFYMTADPRNPVVVAVQVG